MIKPSKLKRREILGHSFFAIALGFATSTAAWADKAEICTPETCGEFGTKVVFADSPAEAAKAALKEEKLVFVLHVSGEFETPEYT